MSKHDTTILIAVRHGETEWNLAGRAQGHLDSPLTDAGILQARSLAEGLSGRGIQAIYSSDLGRAMQTSGIVSAVLNLDVNADSRLRERNFGSMQGLTRDEIRSRFPGEYARLASGDPDYAIPGGESARQRHERCIGACNDLVARHAGGCILVVAHGGVLNSLFYHALGLSLNEPRGRRFSIFNAAVNRFSVSGDDWRLDTWGEISHLKGLDTLDET
jgi:probable phosphoglycerate mutase